MNNEKTKPENGRACGQSAAPCYPLISEYSGGGSILNTHTSGHNMITWCPPSIRNEVVSLIKKGNEVIILNDKIKAVGPYMC